ncbi:hypothetical protein NBRC116592_18350 [Colwellia sp. KU-HH00111]|uniref:polysialyltransferase family glycosyltransferase n=1 Tax=Colwellia sp. KU-HH00111 TaxID=3127652 RepID=UPI0031057870
MINYFFISSPLHFFIATNLAISHKTDTNIALFISKNAQTAKQYAKATKHFNNLFQDTYDLTINDDQQKFKQRKLRFAEIEKVIISTPPNRIFTGSDRRMEFQFAMHKARQVNAEVEGIYIDDGTVSYLGHKSINSIFHKTIDPLLKKIVYGAWWKNALTTGSSSWISKAYLAVPKDAHPLLQTKELIPLEQDVFSTDEFLKVNDFLIANYDALNAIDFTKIKAVLCLPNESFYLKNSQFLQQINQTILQHFAAEEIAIKAHPKSKDMALLAQVFPQSISLPSTLGMELLLPKLSDNTSIIGDVSTALLTAKWLKPKVTVQAFEMNSDISKNLKNLFKRLGINFLTLESV